MRRVAAVLLVTFGVCLAPGVIGEGVAHARGATHQTAAERKATKKFERAGRLFDAGKHERALKLFRQVAKTLHSPNALFMASRCLIDLDRLPEAFETLDDTVALATKRSGDDQSYLQTRDAAAAEREKVAAKIGRLMLAVDDAPDGLRVIVEDRRVRSDSWGRTLGIAAGSVEIVAHAPGYQSLHRELDIEPGQMQTVIVDLKPVGESADAARTSDDDATSGSGDGLRTAGFVVLGLGVVGMGAFAITGVMANKRFSRIEQECGDPPCTDPSYGDLITEGKTLDAVANVSLALGAVGVAAGTAMVIFGWPASEGDQGGSEPADEQARVTLGGGPAGGGINLTVPF